MISWLDVYAAERDQKPSIVIPGVYHDGEAPRRPGDGWFGLVKKGNQWLLLPAKVSSQRVRDEVVDGVGQLSGVKIKASLPTALALLRHPSLLSDVVPSIQLPTSALSDEPEIQIGGPDRRLPFLGNSYLLRAVVRKDGTPTSPGIYGLELSIDGGRRFVLGSDELRDEHQMRLVWAGDLNRDGLPDFLIRHSWYNGEGLCWYLSSKATVVMYQKVGCQYATGC